MTVEVKYISGEEEVITCDRLESDGDVFILITAGQQNVVIPYGGVESINY